MGESRRLHCRNCGQTFFTRDIQKCSLCGASNSLVEPEQAATAPPEDRPSQRPLWVAAHPPPSPFQGLGKGLRAYRGVRFIVAGVFIVGLGLLLMFAPALRSDPNHWSFKDAAYSVVVILVGVVVLGLGVVTIRAVYVAATWSRRG